MRKFFVLFFKVQGTISTIKQDRKLGVVSLCCMEIPNQNMIMNLNIYMIMNLNILAPTIGSFRMLIDYTLDLTPPFSPCLLYLPQKKEKTKKLL